MKNTTTYITLVLLVVVAVIWWYFSNRTELSHETYTATSTVELVVNEPIKEVVTTFPYIEVTSGCNPYYVGECVNVRSGPGKEYPVVMRLRNGVVLRVGDAIITNATKWYPILFTTELLYPKRVKGAWYVSADVVSLFQNDGDHLRTQGGISSSTKRIIVDVSEQKLYAYDDEVLFMEEPISTGLEFTPTPRDTFSILKMTPSRFMQGPIPGVSDQVYDLPGVPWNLYFTNDGAVIHGAYWHDHFGTPWSHGCVNLPPDVAKKLYEWAEVGIKVTVQN